MDIFDIGMGIMLIGISLVILSAGIVSIGISIMFVQDFFRKKKL